MLLLTCTVSMVLHLPETPVQLSMVPRSVYAERFLLGFHFLPCVWREKRKGRPAFQASPPVLQLCGSLGHLSQQLCRRVGFQTIPVSFVFNHVEHMMNNSHQFVCHWNQGLDE